MEYYKNNDACVSGRVASKYVFSHEIYGERFYLFDLAVARLSENVDIIPVMISERITDVTADNLGAYVRINGQFRSFNKREGEKSRLILCFFAQKIEPKDSFTIDDNVIFLDGYVCKPSIYRKTPLGREIADVFVAVNRPYGKSDYIPCIVWGRAAKFAATLKVGQKISLEGRIQSRAYEKKHEDGSVENRVAYEVSTIKLMLPEE